MEKESAIEKSKQYWEKIRNMEIEMFPEFVGGDIFGDKDYFYFAPSWHFKSGLITEQDIIDFKNDHSKKLLSIGSGPAFLEKVLVKLGVKKENITLSDIDFQVLPEDFKSKSINMREDWKTLGDEHYDLIILPESFLGVVKLENLFKVSADEFSQSKKDGLLHVLSQALLHLKPSGKIRINGHQLTEQEVLSVGEQLKSKGYKINIIFSNSLIEFQN